MSDKINTPFTWLYKRFKASEKIKESPRYQKGFKDGYIAGQEAGIELIKDAIGITIDMSHFVSVMELGGKFIPVPVKSSKCVDLESNPDGKPMRITPIEEKEKTIPISKKEALKIKNTNAKHSGSYSSCSRCGGNWGWKKGASHMTSKAAGTFLFCEQCDKIVTIEERWKALDEWKVRCISQVNFHGISMSLTEIMREINYIDNVEFLEWPRDKSKGG